MEPAEVAQHWEANAETWTRHARRGLDVCRDALNTPAFLAISPSVEGLDGLDVGCGEGSNTRQVARHGARMSAVDIAPTFIRHAGRPKPPIRLASPTWSATGWRCPSGRTASTS